MLYNICKGGGERVPLIAKIVRDAKPDILGLLETVGWQNNNLTGFSKTVGLPHAFFSKANTKYDMALLGMHAPREVINIQEGFWHTVVRVVYSIAPIGDLAIFLAHLNPKDVDARFQEVQRIIALARPYRHVILMGDFNSLSPHDPYDHIALLRLLRERGIEKFGRDRLQFDCINFVESLGFIDVMRALKKQFISTVPTPSNQDPMHAVPLRLDYMFISQGLTPFLKDAVVLRTPLTDSASDHYPLVVDFEFVG